MSATNLNALLRVPGRLALNVTSLSGGFPGNGTDLGLVSDVVARPNKLVKKLREEGLGRTTTFGLELGEAWSITAAVRALEQGNADRFLTASAGAVTGEDKITHNPVTTPPGGLSANVAVLFWPFDELQQYFLWFPAAIAFPDVAAEMQKSIQRDGLTFVAFEATPRAADGIAVVQALKPDLVLT